VQATFATEQLVDELAFAAKIDPLEFRRRNLDPANDGNRASTVLEAVAKLANWQPKVAASNVKSGDILTGRGIALGGISFTRAAVVADVQVNKKTGKILVKDLWAVENAGLAVNPQGMENQIVGMLTRGTSRALHEQVTFNTERVTSLDWVSYPTLRFKDSPRTHILTLQQPELVIGGSSEATEVVVPAAIANAFFDATGVRIRTAPMTPAHVRSALKAEGVA
jgi:CO/xanthine dehydrogenase Mo-binding subunit